MFERYRSKSAKQLSGVMKLSTIRGATGGLIKRIDENRELLELLMREAPDLLNTHSWLIDWIRANDSFFTQLREILQICDRLGSERYPRPWPYRPPQWRDETGDRLLISAARMGAWQYQALIDFDGIQLDGWMSRSQRNFERRLKLAGWDTSAYPLEPVWNVLVCDTREGEFKTESDYDNWHVRSIDTPFLQVSRDHLPQAMQALAAAGLAIRRGGGAARLGYWIDCNRTTSRLRHAGLSEPEISKIILGPDEAQKERQATVANIASQIQRLSDGREDMSQLLSDVEEIVHRSAGMSADCPHDLAGTGAASTQSS